MFGVIDAIRGNQISGWINKGASIDCKIEVIINGDLILGTIGDIRPDIKKYQNCYSFTATLPRPVSLSEAIDGEIRVFCVDQENRVELTFWSAITEAAFLERISSENLQQILSFLTASRREELLRGLESPIWLQSKNKNRICVIAYANGPGAWFPYFYSHYSKLFGSENIYIIAPDSSGFDSYSIGGIITLSNAPYNDETRSQLMSRMSQGLLAYYDWTLICDVDEIIIPHPVSGMSFEEMLSMQEADSITTRGFDVLQIEEDGPFDFSKPVLTQRRWGVANSALCKPHLTRTSRRWSAGFHHSDFAPSFSPPASGFITLHLKWACNEVRAALARLVQSTTYADSSIAEYSRQSVLQERHPVFARGEILPTVALDGPEMRAFEELFIERSQFSGRRGVWFSPHFFNRSLVDLVASCGVPDVTP
jgi:hypothetical protein